MGASGLILGEVIVLVLQILAELATASGLTEEETIAKYKEVRGEVEKRNAKKLPELGK